MSTNAELFDIEVLRARWSAGQPRQSVPPDPIKTTDPTPSTSVAHRLLRCIESMLAKRRLPHTDAVALMVSQVRSALERGDLASATTAAERLEVLLVAATRPR